MKKLLTFGLVFVLSVLLCFTLVSCGKNETPDTPDDPQKTCDHEWSRGRTDKEPTCTEPGTILKTCLFCEEIKTEETPALGHDFDTKWSDNSAQHWHACKRSGCKEISDRGNHEYLLDAEKSTPANCGYDGENVFACVCGLSYSEPVAKFGEHTKSDELSYNENEHYYACTVCHLPVESEEHTFATGPVTGLSKDSCTAGTREVFCKCGLKTTQTVLSLVPHTVGYVFDRASGSLKASCSSCHADLVVYSSIYGLNFEKYSAGDHYTSNKNTAGSIVYADENDYKYGYFVHDSDSVNTYITVTPSDFLTSDNFALHIKIMPVHTKDGEIIRGNIAVDAKIGGKWGTLRGITIGTNDEINAGGCATGITAVADTWYEIVYLYMNGEMKIYVDGVCVGNGTMGEAWKTATRVDYYTINTSTKGAGVYIDDVYLYLGTPAAADGVLHEHAWGDGTVTTPASCKEGVKTYTCADCGETKTEVIPASGEHTPAGELLHDENGHWHICSECGEKADYKEHKWNDGEVIKSPNCTETGEKKYTCSECGETKTEVLPVTHVPAGTLSHDGEGHWYECTLCHEKVDYTEHNLEEIEGYVEPTCKIEGKKVYKCSDCEAEVTEILKRTEHDFTESNVTPATCTTEGKRTLTCADCGKVLENVVIPKIPHKLTFTVNGTAVAVACANDGCDMHATYQVKYAGNNDPIAIGGNASKDYNNGTDKTAVLGDGDDKYHSIVRTAETSDVTAAQVQFYYLNYNSSALPSKAVVSITFTAPEAGPANLETKIWLTNNKGAWKDGDKGFAAATLTGGVIADAKGNTLGTYESGTWRRLEIVVDFGAQSGDDGVRENDTYTIVYYLDGELVSAVTVPGILKNDCFTEVYFQMHTNKKGTGLLFRNLGLYIGEDSIMASAHTHDFKDEEVLAEGNCQTSGLVRQICACGEQNLKVTGGSHTWDAGEVTTSATCTTEGEKLFRCKDCTETKTEVIPKSAHNYVEKTEESVAPGCDSDGKRVSYCNDCNDRKEETVPATGHTLTYTKNADKLDVACSVCNKTYASLSTKLSQDFNGYKVGNAGATCSDGAKIVSRSGDASKILERAEGDKFLLICDDCSDNNVAYDFTLSIKEHVDFIIAEMDFMLRWTDGETVVDGIAGLNLHSGKSWNNPGLLTDVKPQGNKVALFGKTTDIDVVTDKWYTARTVVDFVDQVMYVFIDDTLVHTTSTRGMVISNSVTRGNISVLKDGQCARIDNLRIYAGNLDKVEIPEKAVAPTCDKTGSKTYYNPYTGEEETVTVPPLGHTFAFVKNGEKLSAVCSVCTHAEELTRATYVSDNFNGVAYGSTATEDDGNKYGCLKDTNDTGDSSYAFKPSPAINGSEGYLAFTMRYQLKSVTLTGATEETIPVFRAPIKFDVGNSVGQWITPFTFGIANGHMAVSTDGKNFTETTVNATVDVWTDFMIAYEKATGKFYCYMAGTLVGTADANANFKGMTNLQYISIQAGDKNSNGSEVWIDDCSYYTKTTASN